MFGPVWRCLLPAVCGFLAACSQQATPLSVAGLRLPLDAVPGASRLEIKSELRVADQPQGRDAFDAQALRRQQIAETAYFKYHLDGGGAYKVKVTIYADPAAQKRAWAGRYPPAVLQAARPRAWGDTGFLIPGRVGAFGAGRLHLQVEAAGPADDLEAVLAAFAARAGMLGR